MKKFLFVVMLAFCCFFILDIVAKAEENAGLEERTYTDALIMETPVISIEKNGNSVVYTYSLNKEIESKKVGEKQTTFCVENGVIRSVEIDGKVMEYLYTQLIEGLTCTGIIWDEKEYQLEYDENRNVVGIYDEDKCICRYDYSENGLLPTVYNLQEEATVSNSSNFIGDVNPFRYQGWFLDTDINCYYLGEGIFYDPIAQEFIQNEYTIQDWGMEWLATNISTLSLTQSQINNIVNQYNSAMNSSLYGAKAYSQVSESEWNNGKRWYDGVSQLELIARCIHTESPDKARSNDRTGIAVVIMNRMASMSKNGYEVVTQRAQFSSVNPAKYPGEKGTYSTRQPKSKTDEAWQQATMLGCVIIYGAEKDDIGYFYHIPLGISTQLNFRGFDYLTTVSFNGSQVTIGGNAKNDVAIAGYGYINSNSSYQYLEGLKGQHYTLFFND